MIRGKLTMLCLVISIQCWPRLTGLVMLHEAINHSVRFGQDSVKNDLLGNVKIDAK